MSDADQAPAGAARGNSAGALLRAARERQGMHIAALAASIKVTPRKLDALENDRYDELPDATFARALAQTVCRALKIDPQPVLALLPHAGAASLEKVTGSLNTPFRDRPGRDAPAGLAGAAIRPMVWAGGLLMLAALTVLLLPDTLWQRDDAAAAVLPPAAIDAAPAEPSASAATDSDTPAAASAPFVETVHSAPADPAPAAAETIAAAAAAASAPASSAPAALVQLRADEASWIEVRDSRGEILLSRIVQPGETIGLDGALPIRLTIGNAPATRLSFRGRVVDLAPSTRDTVARLELP